MFFTNDQSAILSNYEIHFSFAINSFYFFFLFSIVCGNITPSSGNVSSGNLFLIVNKPSESTYLTGLHSEY
ncbi:hypothetical protein HAP32_02516 [Serratia fonticola]|nr:hypothetical protein HAP32_02516 [Serratia fonticola]